MALIAYPFLFLWGWHLAGAWKALWQFWMKLRMNNMLCSDVNAQKCVPCAAIMKTKLLTCSDKRFLLWLNLLSLSYWFWVCVFCSFQCKPKHSYWASRLFSPGWQCPSKTSNQPNLPTHYPQCKRKLELDQGARVMWARCRSNLFWEQAAWVPMVEVFCKSCASPHP